MAGDGLSSTPASMPLFFAASRHQFLNRRRATGGVDGFFSSGSVFKTKKNLVVATDRNCVADVGARGLGCPIFPKGGDLR